MTGRMSQPIRLGVIVGARGIKGEVRIKSFTEMPEDVAAYGPLFDRTGERQFELRVTGVQKGLVLARIKGIEDRNGAEALKRTELFADRAQLPEADEDEFYNSDLQGLKAVTVSGDDLGTVVGVFDFGAGPVLEVTNGIVVPFTRDAVPEVDIDAGRLVIDPPDGLFDPLPEDEMGAEDAKDETT